MRFRSPAACLAASLAVLVSLTGCGTKDQEQKQAQGQPAGGPVQLLVFGAPEELAAYRTLAKGYEKASGGAKVKLVEASDRKDLIARLSTSIAGGKPPDVFLMNYRFYGQFAAKNAIEPVDKRLGSSKSIAPTDFYPVVLDAFRWQGRQLCMPSNVSSLVVYYNKTLFAKYGVAEPAKGWAWNDFLATATALTRDTNGKRIKGTESEGAAAKVGVHGAGIEPTVIRIAPFVWSNGGSIVDDPRKPTRFTLDSAPAREALRNFLDLRLAYGVVPTDEEVEAEDDESRFVNGRLAMLLSSRRVTATFRSIKDFEWDVAPLPTYGRDAGILHSDAYCITKGSGNKDAAWRFVEYAVGPKGQELLASTGRTVPSHVKVSTSKAFLDPSKPPANAQVFLDAIPTIRQAPTISTWPEIEDVTDGILENALYRGDQLDKVIDQIDKQTRPLFARGETP